MLLQLFLCFLQIGAFSIGGGYAAIPLIQNQTVELRHWLTEEQFMDLAAIAEMTPGPIAVNGATFVGLKIARIPGAIAATFVCILPSLVIVSLLALIYRKYRKLPMLQSVLASLRPAVVALIAAAGLNMLLQIAFGGKSPITFNQADWMNILLFSAAFYALRKRKWNPILVMGLCGIMNLVREICL